MKIRTAQIKDIKECIKLSKKDKYWSENDFKRSLEDKNTIFLVAVEKKVLGYIIGFIVPTKNNEVLIHETFVDARSRGQSIGTKLVKEFVKSSKNRKVYAMIEKELLPFYKQSCGFNISHRWIEVSR